MKMSKTTAEYVADRVDRMMLSLDNILSNSEFTKEQKVEEVEKMLTWHIGRTLNDQKSQIKFVMKKKAPDVANVANLVVDSFNMRLLPYKALNKGTTQDQE